MKQTIGFYQFAEAFRACGRENQFSREELSILFDYLEEYEDSTGEEIELDVVALCCDFSGRSWQDIASDYLIDVADLDDDEGKDAVREYLEENTMICGETEEGFVYQQF